MRTRTADLSLTMAALYRLSYKGNCRNDSLWSLLEFLNCVKGIWGNFKGIFLFAKGGEKPSVPSAIIAQSRNAR